MIGFFWLLELKEENGLELTFNYKIMQCAWIKLLIMHGMHGKDILKKIYLCKWFVLQYFITFYILSFIWYVIFKLHLPNKYSYSYAKIFQKTMVFIPFKFVQNKKNLTSWLVNGNLKNQHTKAFLISNFDIFKRPKLVC